MCESGRYHLFYSANWWESDGYGVGYAVGDSVLGPYRKVTTRKAWFGSDSVVAGPGGQELFTGPDGGWRMAYHGWTPGQVGYPNGGARSLHIVTVDFAGRRPSVLSGERSSVESTSNRRVRWISLSGRARRGIIEG